MNSINKTADISPKKILVECGNIFGNKIGNKIIGSYFFMATLIGSITLSFSEFF